MITLGYLKKKERKALFTHFSGLICSEELKILEDSAAN